jgi:hypothetical protein
VVPPKPDTRDSLSVTFPWPLDHALLQSAIGVFSADNQVIPGTVSVEANETRWVFRPETRWQGGPYQLRILKLLEDPSGNQMGHAFEMKPGTAANSRAEPEMELLPFVVSGRRDSPQRP